MEYASEFLCRHVSLAEEVVVLEKLLESDSVLFYQTLDFVHQFFMFFDSCEVQVFWYVRRFQSCGGAVDCVFKAVTILKKFCILYLANFVTVNQTNLCNLINCQVESQMGQDLSEDLLADLEMNMFVKVLEKALCIKSVLPNDFFKSFDDVFHLLAILFSWILFAVNGLSADIIKVNVIIFLKILLGEYFINSIHKVFPANVFAFLWSLEFLRQQFKFLT